MCWVGAVGWGLPGLVGGVGWRFRVVRGVFDGVGVVPWSVELWLE